MPAIRLEQVPISLGELLGRQDGVGGAPEQLGAVGVLRFGELVEPTDELVIELDQDLTACQDHMCARW